MHARTYNFVFVCTRVKKSKVYKGGIWSVKLSSTFLILSSPLALLYQTVWTVFIKVYHTTDNPLHFNNICAKFKAIFYKNIYTFLNAFFVLVPLGIIDYFLISSRFAAVASIFSTKISSERV